MAICSGLAYLKWKEDKSPCCLHADDLWREESLLENPFQERVEGDGQQRVTHVQMAPANAKHGMTTKAPKLVDLP